MSNDSSATSAPRPPWLPFLVADLLLLGTAGWIAWQARAPLDALTAGIISACVAVGGWLCVWPFVLAQRARLQVFENQQLLSAASQIKDLQSVGKQIASATAQWQSVQEGAARTAGSAQEIADRIAGEARQFREFIQKGHEDERAHLRLEIEKLRRNEAEWLQGAVRVLDHIHALHAAGLRSGQRPLIENLTQFQSACRDALRRLGLVALVPPADATYDPEAHQLLEGTQAEPGAPIEAVLATGYSYQGKLLRLPLVAARSTAAQAALNEPEGASPDGTQRPAETGPELPLEGGS